MSFGDSGGGGQQQVSRPLNAAERQELFQAAMKNMGPAMPSVADYRSYEVVDPSADRGRGPIYNGRTGYGGYANTAPIVLKDNGANYANGYQSAVQDTQKTVAEKIAEYFKQRDAEIQRQIQEQQQQQYGG